MRLSLASCNAAETGLEKIDCGICTMGCIAPVQAANQGAGSVSISSGWKIPDTSCGQRRFESAAVGQKGRPSGKTQLLKLRIRGKRGKWLRHILSEENKTLPGTSIRVTNAAINLFSNRRGLSAQSVWTLMAGGVCHWSAHCMPSGAASGGKTDSRRNSACLPS